MPVYQLTRAAGNAVVQRDGQVIQSSDFYDFRDQPRIEFDFGRHAPGCIFLAYLLLRDTTNLDEALYRLENFTRGVIERMDLNRAACTTEGIRNWLAGAEAHYPIQPFRAAPYTDRFVLGIAPIPSRPASGGDHVH